MLKLMQNYHQCTNVHQVPKVKVLSMQKIVFTFFYCRYLDTFHQAGLLLARDFTHLDHDALVSLGIAATGHRKRILRLVGYMQTTEAQRANQKTDLPRGRCHSVTERASSEQSHNVSLHQSTGPVNFKVFRNSSVPNIDAMLTNSESTSCRAVVKPVPKPRTVFNRRRTAPIHFCPTPDPAPPRPRRLSQESICLPVLEGLTSGDTHDGKSTTGQRPSQTERMRPSRSLSLSDAGGLLPPVPPRQNRGVPHSMFQASPYSSSPSDQNQTLSSLPSCPGSFDSSRLSGSSPAGSQRDGGEMEMVSNEIYWGTSPGSTAPLGRKSYGSQQSAPPTPPRQTPDRNPERNR